MPKKLNYQLSESELKAVEIAQRKGTSSALRQRATGIRLLHLGKTPTEVSEILNVSLATVYNWHERFRKKGVEGLGDESRSGRPPLATVEYCQVLERAIATDPTELGYGFTIWTLKRLCAHLHKETGIRLSKDTLRSVLAEHDFVYRRPKHDLRPLQTAAARRSAEELLESLKKKPKEAKSNYSLWTKVP